MNSLILCKLPILFLAVKIKLEQIFPIHANIQNWEFLSVGLRLHFHVSPNSQTDLGFLSVAVAGLLNFSQFMKKMESWIF